MLRTRLEFLSSDELDLIHDQTMRVLNEVGVSVPADGALEIFTKHGARVDGQRVYLDEGLVLRALSNVPSEFTIHARDGERSVVVGGDGHVLAPAYGAPFVMEPDGTARPALLQEYENLARLADVLTNM
nr:trimethylamine methyltransferase family protein [Ardenticatenia bacterium]